MKTRDKLKQEKKFEDYKKQRNKITNLVRAAKRAYFEMLINHIKDTSSLWRAVNETTHKSRSKSASCEINPQTTVHARTMKSHLSLKSSVKIEYI